MQSKHYLIEKAVQFEVPSNRPDVFPDSEYDDAAGGWRHKATGELVAARGIDGIFPGTKKNDVETGEDQKGQ
ncbi:hypothetical protein ETAA8_08900 [Anatilimnocola aggregata]|uniref:Uncharacterized protein n=1 Tax=Anatilimnocola aggregata TaxID=2528021 RepID=A0A517Y6F8_9BACT|nr:hypothetical protein ETAA8_08900 [Anatilimnocola aggregata]